MKDYRVTVKIRNNRILKAIEESGGTPGNKWCKANGLRYYMVNDLINMTISPINQNGELLQDAERLCDVLGKLPDELWSNEQLYPLEKNFSEFGMDYAQVVSMLPSDQQSYIQDFSEFEQKQIKGLLDTVLSTLSERQLEVINMRFNDELTYAECAKRIGITKERVRQIEDHAMRTLRHPTRAAILVDAIDISDSERKEYKEAAGRYLSEKC